MTQLNLRLPHDLKKMAEKYAKRHGYKNLQELAKESIRMRVSREGIVEAENLWKELPKETREGIEEISKRPKSEWKKWYKGIKESEKRRLKLLTRHS
ncbi:MAG: hypothetical protein HY361_01050 [Candidatus Aenigmarchaeota archaeon]|nr:hypothetical protein [Candidatus Aenigmarchaeota archaeon]